MMAPGRLPAGTCLLPLAPPGPDWDELTEAEATIQAAIAAEELALLSELEPPDEIGCWLADPDCGPPDGPDADLRDLASPARDAILDARAAASRAAVADVIEPFPAGVICHDGSGPGGSGFASGSALDGLAPGSVLTAALDETWQRGLGVLTDDELAGVALAFRRCESRAAAGLAAAVGELARRRDPGTDSPAIDHAGDEIAILLTMTRRSAGRLADFARSMSALPATAAALAEGRIDRARADVIAWETALLDPELAGAVELLVIEDAPALTTTLLTARVRRAVLAADPDAARRRKEQAAKDARVELFDERCGTAGLAGRDLPVPAALAADQRIDAAARALKASGVRARLTQLRAAVFLGLLTSQDPLCFLPARHDEPDGPPGERSGPSANSDAGTDGDQAAASLAGLPAPALPGSVHLTLPLAAWLGISGSPGEIAGFGPASAEDCRALASHVAASPGSRWCLTLTDTSGHAVGHGCTRRAPPPSADPARLAAWLASLKISPVQAGACTHVREAARYRIPRSLHHVVNVRQRTCVNPVCPRPAEACDTDHTLPYDQGGRTCECNLGPACRACHQVKQASGWKLVQPAPGVFAWQLPHGRRYEITPGVYPQ